MTINQVLAWEPCASYDRKRVTELFAGRECLTPLEVLDLGIPAKDRIWAVIKMMTPEGQRWFTCDCAEHVLPIWEQKYPDDDRPRQAIEVARRYALRQATVAELHVAGAAWDAERQGQIDRLRLYAQTP